MNKIFKTMIFLLCTFGSSVAFSQMEITVTGTRGPAGGGVGLVPPGNVYDRTEEQAKKAAAEAAAKAEKESRAKAKASCKAKNLDLRISLMADARRVYEEKSARCGLYTTNAVVYGGIATTGVATIPAAVVGGGFAIAAYYCEKDAQSERDASLQSIQDNYDKWDLTVCETI